MKKLLILSGAGISAESGIQTFLDEDGLWEDHDSEDVASPEGWANNPELVLNFYNDRRRQLFEVEPNEAHIAIADLEGYYNVDIITQNVDDLHERAGSSSILHLHGELRKVRSNETCYMIYDWDGDLNLGDIAEDGTQLRPDIVWLGEDVPLIENAIPLVENANIIIIIGTSMQVYPAAGLINYASETATIYYIDPKADESNNFEHIISINEKASVGIAQLMPDLMFNS